MKTHNRIFRFRIRYLITLSSFLLLALCANAQISTIQLNGTVTDAATKQPIAGVSVYFKGSSGVLSDSTGHFSLLAARRFIDDTHLHFAYVGYKDYQLDINFSAPPADLQIELTSESNNLEDVTVGHQKERYRNKGNPAVELIRQVIAHRDENKMDAYDYASYKEYEKMVVSLSNFSEKLKNKKALTKYQFLLNNVDTTRIKGKSLLPLYLEELNSENFYRKDPKNQKKIITAQNKVDFGEFIDTKGITKYLKSLYADINIYDNNITLLTNQFLSPIANSAPTFYKFYIRDTMVVDGVKIVHLGFTPRNPQDMLFRGTLDITLDGHYAVQKVRMFSPNSINFNFLRSMQIDLDFLHRPDGKYLLTKSDILADFGIAKKGMGVYGERLTVFKDFETGNKISPKTFSGADVVISDSALKRDPKYWETNRYDTLTTAESKTYQNIDSLKNMKSFKRVLDWATFIIAGYKQAGPVEIGPANTFYSFNPVEGFRLRLGGRTTTKLSKRYYFEGYGAYGFGDTKWKYFGSASYSLNNKSIYEFPQNYLRASFQHDTKIPGQELQFVQEDNFLLSFKRGDNYKWLYNDIFRLEYQKEFENHFSYNITYKYWKQTPGGSLTFDYPSGVINNQPADHSLATSEFGITLRYAPNEVFYQGKLYRVPLVNKYPIFQFRYLAGFNGFLGGQYNYQNFGLNIQKRFYLSQFGYTDVTLDGGYILGKLPYPLLDLPHANQTFAYQLMSFNMMNFLEFASDHYVSIMADHYFNGFIMNKIPLIKKLKWRSVVEGKLLYGGLRDENNPNVNNQQMSFPMSNGQVSTFALTRVPYFEAGFGIMNIFKFIRLDYIRRFSYLEHADIPKWGIRFRVKFDF